MKKLKLAFISTLPPCLVLVLMVIFAMPKHISGLSGIMPLIHLVPVFVWGVMHPRDMPFWLVAVAGLIVDTATGLPLGLSALSYFFFLALVRTQRKYIYREGFAPMWGYFALLLLVMQLASWGMYSFTLGTRAPFANALMQWGFTVLLYPMLHFLLYPLVEKMAVARYRLNHA